MNNLRVAIVDDDSGTRESYKRFLKREYKKRYEDGNIDINIFADGHSAIEFINAPDNKIDVVILDYHLPDMLGDEVLLRLRERDKNIPVVMITALDSSEITRATFKAGGSELTEYIPKPPDFKLLIYTIELLCERHKSMVFQNQLLEVERSHKLLKEISENWKQPMNIVSMILYRMVEEDDENIRNELYDSAYAHIKKASSLLDVFKDYTLLSKDIDEYDLVSTIKQSVDAHKDSFFAQGIDIKFLNDMQVFRMTGYEKLIERALFHIFRNCEGALNILERDDKKIIVKLEDIGLGCNLTIRDNAGKIRDDLLESIFDPSYESDKKSRNGMELYLSYLFLNANRAAIKCSNHEDGVKFTIYFR
ncbi:MAG: response regulator [Campylobacterales bacterium]